MLMRASLVTSPLLTHLQSINIDSINWLNHLINSDMKLTADHPAGGSVNMCTWTAPSLTSSLLNLSISPYCISPDRQRIALVSWIYYTVNILSEGKHKQELMVESCANTELPPDEDFCQNIGCVCVCYCEGYNFFVLLSADYFKHHCLCFHCRNIYCCF